MTPPSVFLGHTHDKSRNVRGSWRTSWTSVLAASVFHSDQLPVPRQKRLRRHDCRDLRQNFPAEPFGFHCQPATLIIGKTHATVADLLPQRNTIFCNEIFDDLLLPLIHPTGDRDDEKGKWIQTRLHSGRLPRGRNALSSSKPSTIDFLDSSASSEGWHVQWESVPSGQESEPCNLGRICGGNEADEADRQSHL